MLATSPRRSARRSSPGTPDPVAGADEVVAFAEEHGLPIAIKAAFGGGGRGLKVARTLAEIPELFESATREAITAFGRGECFVEKYLDKPRHVETQCLADSHGNVVVVSTRDCSLQRRHQKLVEEAPAPFLTDGRTELYEPPRRSSRGRLRRRRHLRVPGRQDGTISFLEVNTRLQVEHPVSEEVTGIDLVREQFRIAEGERHRLRRPEAAGALVRVPHQRRGPGPQLPARPRTGQRAALPRRPRGARRLGCHDRRRHLGRVRLAARQAHRHRYANRAQALERSRRALDEFEVAGLPTVLPFHRKIVRDPAFTDSPFRVYTRWIETEFDNDDRAVQRGAGPDRGRRRPPRHNVVVEVGGSRVEVSLPSKLSPSAAARRPGQGAAAPRRSTGGAKASAPSSGDAVGRRPCRPPW